MLQAIAQKIKIPTIISCHALQVRPPSIYIGIRGSAISCALRGSFRFSNIKTRSVIENISEEGGSYGFKLLHPAVGRSNLLASSTNGTRKALADLTFDIYYDILNESKSKNFSICRLAMYENLVVAFFAVYKAKHIKTSIRGSTPELEFAVSNLLTHYNIYNVYDHNFLERLEYTTEEIMMLVANLDDLELADTQVYRRIRKYIR